MILQELLEQAKSLALAQNIPETDFWFLISYYLHLSRSEIFLSRQRILTDREREIIENAFSRLEKGEPPQYITGGIDNRKIKRNGKNFGYWHR